MFTFGGDYSAEDGKAVEPVPLHVYTKPPTMESVSSKVQKLLTGDEDGVRQTLSAQVGVYDDELGRVRHHCGQRLYRRGRFRLQGFLTASSCMV